MFPGLRESFQAACSGALKYCNWLTDLLCCTRKSSDHHHAFGVSVAAWGLRGAGWMRCKDRMTLKLAWAAGRHASQRGGLGLQDTGYGYETPATVREDGGAGFVPVPTY